jgi:hypothetical protein
MQRGGILYDAWAELLASCQDLNDYYGLGDAHIFVTGSAASEPSRVLLPSSTKLGEESGGFYGLAQCGYGTHTEQCGERVVYVHADAPGGCEQTCHNPVMEGFIDHTWNIHNKFGYSTFCSDGGEGSHRVLFAMPAQKDPRADTSDFSYAHRQEASGGQFRYYDFACEQMLLHTHVLPLHYCHVLTVTLPSRRRSLRDAGLDATFEQPLQMRY